MKRQVVSKLKLSEISSVDRPAQVGAVSVLMKRGQDPEAGLLKASFKEALDGRLIDEKVQQAFYNSFDKVWTGQDAFRKALTDELRDGGDGATASTAYKDWINDLVDKAVAAAKDAGAGDAVALDKAFTQTLDTAVATRLAKKETTMTIKTKADLTAAITKAQADGDKLTVGEVTAIHKAATDLNADDLLPATGVLAKSAKKDEDEETKKKVARMEKRDALATDLRKHYDGLDNDADRDAFLAKSATDQAVLIEKARGDDPVVYTTLDGIDIRKSAGDTTLALAKRLDTQSKELAKANASAEDVSLTKRAGDVLGNVGGDVIGKKALLKAVDGIADTATRDAALAVLGAANTIGKAAFRKNGSTAGSDEAVQPGADGYVPSEAEAQLDEMAKAHAKSTGVTFEKAYSEVVQTAEGASLYKRFVEAG